MKRRGWLALEFLGLFAVFPFVFRAQIVPLSLFPTLWVVTGICLAMLARSPGSRLRELWDPAGVKRHAALVILPFVAAAPLLLGFTGWYEPERLFAFVRQRPLLWGAVMLLYPVLSVWPQGVVYRSFVFRRYAALFPAPWMRILASALAFGLVHIVFRNWIAPTFAFAGGLLFAWTLERTRSPMAATVQHALFGCWLFTTGSGWHFYYGAVRRAIE